MKTFKERLKFLIEKHKTNISQLSLNAQIPYVTLSMYLRSDRTPSAKNVSKIAKFFNVNMDWLITGQGPIYPEEQKQNNLIPVFGKVPAGFPAFSCELVLDWILFPGGNPEKHIVVLTKGDSMLPLIHPKDYILVDIKYNTLKNNDIIIAQNNEGESTVKQFFKKGDKIFLKSLNPAYPDIELKGEWKIIGKVIEIWRKIPVTPKQLLPK